MNKESWYAGFLAKLAPRFRTKLLGLAHSSCYPAVTAPPRQIPAGRREYVPPPYDCALPDLICTQGSEQWGRQPEKFMVLAFGTPIVSSCMYGKETHQTRQVTAAGQPTRKESRYPPRANA